MSSDVVSTLVNDHIATVTMSRPSAGNAINEAMAFALKDAITDISQNDDVRVVVLMGQGSAFCSGTDLSRVSQSDAPHGEISSYKISGCIAGLAKPVIAAINGDAIDQGLELALGCDIRVASSEAKFGLTQVKDGRIPWDGGTQRLPRLVGRGVALEMILTSRVVNAEEALAIGLVNKVVASGDVPDSALKVAQTIASHGPIAAGYLKEAVLKGVDMTLEQGLRLEADLNLLLQTTADRVEGIQSFLQRRSPDYSGK